MTYSTNIYQPFVEAFARRHGYTTLVPRAALIDMDGTLYDSMPLHAKAWKAMCDSRGITASEEEFFICEGRTGASVIDLLYNRQYGHPATEDEHKQLYAIKSDEFNRMPQPPVMPGAQAIMDFFKTTGMKRVLVTGSGQNSLLNRLDNDYPEIFLENMRITSRDVTKGKPDPEPYLKALEKAQTAPWNAVALENAPLGVESAAKAGVFCIAVTTGPIPASEMERAGAAVVFDSMQHTAEAMPLLYMALLNYSPR